MQNLRFRVFVNPVEGKMWAVGIDANFEQLDSERINGSWTTVWDRADESPKHHFRFHSKQLEALRPMQARIVFNAIRAKCREGYSEVLLPMVESNWGFVLDPTSVEPTLVPDRAGMEDDPVSDVTLTEILEIDEEKLERAGYIAIDI